jgi:hypothetical protein
VVLYWEEYGEGVDEYVEPVGDAAPLVCGCGRA